MQMQTIEIDDVRVRLGTRHETTTITEVNSLDQTRTRTTRTSYKTPKQPQARSATSPTT